MVSVVDTIGNHLTVWGPMVQENLDETSLKTVQQPVKILVSEGQKQVGRCVLGERGQLVTCIAAINAIGNHTPPMFVLLRVNFRQHMIRGALPIVLEQPIQVEGLQRRFSIRFCSILQNIQVHLQRKYG